MSQDAFPKIEILLVEDSPTQALLLKEALEKRHVTVVVAKDGLDALQKLPQINPEAIISDIEMPRMNGYELCRHLKADDELKTIPVILLTNLTNTLDVIKGIECGADSFLTKPCDIDFLLTTIKDILENKKLRQELIPGKQMEFIFGGQHHLLQLDQVQITDLLLSTYANAIQKNLELEQAYRKINLSYEELERKKEELELLNTQKNQLLGMAAHDMRNPLGVIQGYSEWLLTKLEGKAEEQCLKMIERIKQNSSFMLRLINDLLDLSVIESGTVSLHLSETNLPEIISEALIFLKEIAGKKNIELKFICTKPIASIRCDANKIVQVINNLVSNAVKFSHPGGTIEITLEKIENNLVLSVKDSGIGLSLENKERLFQPFKTSAAGTAGEKGTGLGLAIVHKIIAEHKGKIEVESEEGKGSTFSITLPATL